MKIKLTYKLYAVAMMIVGALPYIGDADSLSFPSDSELRSVFGGTNTLEDSYCVLEPHFENYYSFKGDFSDAEVLRFSHVLMTNLVCTGVSSNGLWLEDGFYHKIAMMDILLSFDTIKTNLEDICYVAESLRTMSEFVGGSTNKLLEAHNHRVRKYRRLLLGQLSGPVSNLVVTAPVEERVSLVSNIVERAALSVGEKKFLIPDGDGGD